MRNMKRVALLSGAVGMTMMVADVAEAAPIGGCGNAFTLMTVSDVLEQLAAPGFEEAIQGADRNADGFLCVRITDAPGLVKLFEPNTPFAYIDNNVQRGH